MLMLKHAFRWNHSLTRWVTKGNGTVKTVEGTADMLATKTNNKEQYQSKTEDYFSIRVESRNIKNR